MTRSLIYSALVPVLLLCAVPAHSGPILVSTDLNLPGDNLLTYDPLTGLRWLDVTVTDGQSLNQVVSQLGPDKALFGFRYATLSEVYSLWEHADINTGGLPSQAGSGTVAPSPTAADYAPIAAFQNFVGLTDIGCCGTVDSIGLVADYDPGAPGDHIIAMARRFEFGIYAGSGGVFATADGHPISRSYNVASWLVEGTFVPFPPPASVPDSGPSLPLLGTGLAGLGRV